MAGAVHLAHATLNRAVSFITSCKNLHGFFCLFCFQHVMEVK